MKLNPLPAFSDNYIWMLHDKCRALVVDPGDAEPVMQALQSAGLQLEGILVTHHHQDHTGGVDYLREATGAKVYGPLTEKNTRAVDPPVRGAAHTPLRIRVSGDRRTGTYCRPYCLLLRVDGKAVRCFLRRHLVQRRLWPPVEGTAQQMFASLQALAALPASTKVCCTHEYTLSNLKFACEVEPDNRDLIEYQASCRERRSRGEPTLPSSIGLEQSINLFYAVHFPR